jgi:hypothetical protein
VSRPPVSEYGAKGQASSPEKITQQHCARDLWLDACLLFCQQTNENMLSRLALTTFPFAFLVDYRE